MPSKKFASVTKQCVACGCCIKVCPKNAITIYHGCYAVIDKDTCIGCGKCEKTCPASVIQLNERGSLS